MNNNTSPTLSIADIIAVRNTIDVACSRGAFRAGEMKDIGELYERICGFVDNVVAQAEAAQKQAEAEAAEQKEPQGESQ